MQCLLCWPVDIRYGFVFARKSNNVNTKNIVESGWYAIIWLFIQFEQTKFFIWWIIVKYSVQYGQSWKENKSEIVGLQQARKMQFKHIKLKMKPSQQKKNVHSSIYTETVWMCGLDVYIRPIELVGKMAIGVVHSLDLDFVHHSWERKENTHTDNCVHHSPNICSPIYFLSLFSVASLYALSPSNTLL